MPNRCRRYRYRYRYRCRCRCRCRCRSGSGSGSGSECCRQPTNVRAKGIELTVRPQACGEPQTVVAERAQRSDQRLAICHAAKLTSHSGSTRSMGYTWGTRGVHGCVAKRVRQRSVESRRGCGSSAPGTPENGITPTCKQNDMGQRQANKHANKRTNTQTKKRTNTQTNTRTNATAERSPGGTAGVRLS